MTDLYNGQLTDLLQNQLKQNPELEALSYAMRLETQRIIGEARQTRTMSVIDELPEDILDVLAVELRGPYYREDLTIERKREIIKNALKWYAKAGTPAAVAEMASAIFGGEGSVVEWFDFDPNHGPGVPGEFDVETNGEMQDPAVYMEAIAGLIERVKNVRSHLRQVHFLRFVRAQEKPMVLPQLYPVTTVSNTIRETRGIAAGTVAASFLRGFGTVTIR